MPARSALAAGRRCCRQKSGGKFQSPISLLTRGQMLRDADLTLERRDILTVRDALLDMSAKDSLEISQSVAVGMPLLNRCLRQHPLIKPDNWWMRCSRWQLEKSPSKSNHSKTACSAKPCGCAIPKPATNSMERCKMKKALALLCDPIPLITLLLTFQVTTLVADSLWKEDTSPTSIFADKKARRVGDIITIVIQENNGPRATTPPPPPNKRPLTPPSPASFTVRPPAAC